MTIYRKLLEIQKKIYNKLNNVYFTIKISYV